MGTDEQATPHPQPTRTTHANNMPCCFAAKCRRHGSAMSEDLLKVSVDGLHGEKTIMALQIMLKSADMPRVGPTDGRLGRRTVRALQTLLWAKGVNPGPVDGWFGRRTIKGLQEWLAAGGFYDGPMSGQDSPETWMGLQNMLNAFADGPSQEKPIKDAVVVEAPAGDKTVGLLASKE